MKEYYLCKLHNEVFEVAETRINTECFLPIREGVSEMPRRFLLILPFPPYTGGCIAVCNLFKNREEVSSLYGRVYRKSYWHQITGRSFLPIREGVSARIDKCCASSMVSSLYGRVYHLEAYVDEAEYSFLPIREGVSSI